MLTRFCLYGFLKNQRYFEPFFMLALLAQGLSFFWIGVLYAVRSLTLNLLEIPSGAMADRWGRRGSMIVSFVAYVLSFLLFAFAPYWWWFFPAMVLFGIGDSFRTGTHKAMIFEWLRIQGRESERTRIYGITRSWSKFGSAVSALLAAVFVLVTGDYRSVFVFSTIPYLLNIINFLGYPRELDGQQQGSGEERVGLRSGVGAVFRQIVDTLRSVWRIREMRRLTAESMAWEGILHAVKDYLQPVLTAVVLVFTLQQVVPAASGNSVDLAATSGNPAVVILIGVTYSVLFLLSGWASRSAHRVVAAAGSESSSASRLWRINLVFYLLLGMFDLLGWMALVAAMFIGLVVLQNVWRPILISRFDQYADPGSGATVLSIESQAQRLTTMAVAPLVGLSVDLASQSAGNGQFWPIGVLGSAAAILILLTAKTSVEGEQST